jgi:hypothetical protein
MHSIRFLYREDIDVKRWDRCVRQSTVTDVYALSDYLDIMAKHWGGLVQDDYDAVLPIPWNRKFCIAYIYTPRFTSPLPLCGNPETALPLSEFLLHLPKRFRLWDMDIRGKSTEQSLPYARQFRNNHLLSLDPAADTLRSHYRPSYRNLLRQCKDRGFVARTCTDYVDLIQKACTMKKIRGMKEDDYDRFEKLCHHIAGSGMLQTWETINPAGIRCAGAIFFNTEAKVYYMLAWNNEEGRRAGASHLLMDTVIATHAGSGRQLDFEGSDHPGIARFFEGFGAKPHPYLAIRYRSWQ